MITNLSNKVAVFLLQKSIIPKEEGEICAYGLELILSEVINFGIILVLGILLHRLTDSVIFLLCFVPTRRYSGGYHASTHGRCRSAMIATFLVLVLGAELLSPQDLARISLMIIASLIVFLRMAPIENPNKPLSPDGRTKNRTRALLCAEILSVLSLVLCAMGRTEGVVMALTLFIISSLMIIEKEKRRTPHAE